jgi:hypothetical protein
MGIVQGDGAFELSGSLGKGALPGEYDVLVEWNQVSPKRKGTVDLISCILKL